jgi:ankyrin repeat protein
MEKQLIDAIFKGDLAEVKILLDQGANPDLHGYDENDPDGEPALLLAIDLKHTAIVKELLNHGADPDLRVENERNETPLIRASRKRNLEIVNALLDRGADPNLRGGEDNETALMKAAEYNLLDIVKALLSHGADPNIPASDLTTALMFAASRHGTLEIVRELLDRDVDPNQQDNWGETALMMATMRHETDIVRLLLERGADPTIANFSDITAIDIARKTGLPELIEILNINPSTVDPETGISNLIIAAANGPLNLLKSMIDMNPTVNLNQQDRDGNTPLIFAIVNRKPEHVYLLLDRGADPNIANHLNAASLAYAIATNQRQVEDLLLDAGAQL